MKNIITSTCNHYYKMNEIVYIFWYWVSETQYVFHTYSISQFLLATFQVKNMHSDCDNEHHSYRLLKRRNKNVSFQGHQIILIIITGVNK